MKNISASFDDGSEQDFRLAELMMKYKIQTTFYIPTNYKKYLARKGIKPLSDIQLNDISNNFEIGSHGVNHELLTRVDDKQQQYEIEESKREFERIFDRKIEKFCYPRGYYTEEIKDKVKRAGYKMARTVKVGELTRAKDPFETHTTVHIGLNRKEYGTDWLTYARRMIAEAKVKHAKGEDVFFHFWGHGHEIGRLDQWDRVEQFMELLDENLLS